MKRLSCKNQALIENYLQDILTLDDQKDAAPPPQQLQLWQNEKGLNCFYAPFDYVNTGAKVVLVGITPGHTQMNRSLNSFRQAYRETNNIESALQCVKQQASLSGTMRSRIIDLLNHLGFADKLNISCSSSLWDDNNHLVHFCSLLKYPVFIHGRDYNGQPALLNNPQLTQLLLTQFINDLSTINDDAIVIPLGETVARVISELKQQGHIRQTLPTLDEKVVGIPHPSGANAESIALLLSDNFPTLLDYQNRMYQAYIQKQSRLKEPDSKQQKEQDYKKARASRWQAVSRVRQAYKVAY